jgi:serine/threonine protein kinase
MPLCERNLQEVIDKEGGPLNLDATLGALRAIAAGLLEVKDIVHRDLKPANVLYHEGRWKLADFGIAKFVEDSTSLETLRASLTPLYAAPEQWRLERPTAATDVYALGCILYALTTGKPPFGGTFNQLRDAHLQAVPTQITTCPPRLAIFASLMLRKPPQARPTLSRCRDILAEEHVEIKSLSPARHALSQAALLVEQRTAREDAERTNREEASKRRLELARNAIADLQAIVAKVDDAIKHSYEGAKRRGDLLQFGAARFGLARAPDSTNEFWWHRSELRPLVEALRWDIVASSIITVVTTPSEHGREYAWSASLIYADRNDGHGYRWYEVAFFTSALSRKRGNRDEPYALELHERDFFQALSPAMHSVAVAYGPLPIDGEDEADFIERWLGLIAKAAAGQLEQPRSMPVRTFG